MNREQKCRRSNSPHEKTLHRGVSAPTAVDPLSLTEIPLVMGMDTLHSLNFLGLDPVEKISPVDPVETISPVKVKRCNERGRRHHHLKSVLLSEWYLAISGTGQVPETESFDNLVKNNYPSPTT